MNQIFLGQPSDYIKNWFISQFPTWPTYTTLKFVDGSTQTKNINGTATWENIGVKGYWYDTDTTLTYCQLGKNVTEISNDTFYECTSLSSISITSSVTSIGSNAFFDCSSLTSVNIPNSVITLGASIFGGCHSLTSVNIPSSVTSIGSNAFQYCSSLASVSIPNSVTSIGEYVFLYDDQLIYVIFEGRTLSEITAMANYPWGITNISAIKPGIS